MAERRGSMRAIGAELPRIAGAVLGRRGLGEAQLLTHWAEIMGEALAGEVVPERLSFARGERRNGTLRLRVAGGLALELQHREPVLIERINAFFGYRAVARLVLVQGPATLRPAPSREPPARPLSPAERRNLDARLDGVADPALRQALAQLGQAVIGRAQK